MEVDAVCPYCGEAASLWIDDDGGASQSYVEDCAVCCRPWQVVATQIDDGEFDVSITRLGE